ncbi:MAG: ferrous iron transport protein A [Firmicutes bacterium]|nr:ferrous iron transport protein A [Bacillota bacterium]
MEIPLSRLCPGVWANVTQIRCPQALKCRLRSFGLVPGTGVCVRYRSPEGGVTAIELRQTLIAMRTKDLHRVMVESDE